MNNLRFSSLPGHRDSRGGNGPKIYSRPVDDTTTFRSEVVHSIYHYRFKGPIPDEAILRYRLTSSNAPLLLEGRQSKPPTQPGTNRG